MGVSRQQDSQADARSWNAWVDSGEWEQSFDTVTPMIPALAVEVARLAQNPDVSAIKLTQVISKDPVLAANVVRLANSAFSASATSITSLNDAVVRVGTRAVRQLVTACCFTSRLRSSQTYGAGVRDMVDHAIGTAYLAWMLADRLDDDPDAAFLYGLLHDIGKFVILKLAREDHPAPAAISSSQLAEFIETRHAAVGGRALARWNFPPDIQMPVAWHHEPSHAHGHRKWAAIAYAANRLAHRYGFGCETEDADLLGDETFVKLRVDAALLGELDTRGPGLFEIARKIAS